MQQSLYLQKKLPSGVSHPTVAAASGRVEIVCPNSPNNTTLSGSRAKVTSLVSLLETERIFTRLLKVDIAYHSSYMEAIAAGYQGLIAGLKPRGHERNVSFPSSFSKVAPAELLETKH